MTAYRNVASLILTSMLLQAAAGLLSVLTPLSLDAMGANALGVGVVAAVFAAGFMLGAWASPDLVRNIGHIRAYSAAAAIYAAGILAMPLLLDPNYWGVLRFAQGAASAVMFTAAESWIADSTPKAQRGAVMGLYQVLIKAAMSVGPLLVVDMAPDSAAPFLVAGILMALAIVPLCATRKAQPVLPSKGRLTWTSVSIVAPSAMIGAMVAGFANGGVMAQLPLFASELRPADAQSAAATLAIAAWMGGVVTQWPAGLISDRMDRRLVVAGLAMLAGVAAIVLFLTGGGLGWTATVALAALWGGGSMSFYAVAAAHATDRVELDQIAEVMSAMMFGWALASVLGPVASGLIASSPLGQPGVFLLSAFAYAGLVVANVGRLAMRRRPKEVERTPFAPVLATSVVYGEVEQQIAEENQRAADEDGKIQP